MEVAFGRYGNKSRNATLIASFQGHQWFTIAVGTLAYRLREAIHHLKQQQAASRSYVTALPVCLSELPRSSH